MTGRLLTRRAFPVLVAALSLGTSGTALAASANVDTNGVLTITGDADKSNYIAIYKTSPSTIIVSDGEADTVPPEAPALPVDEILPQIFPGANCFPHGTANRALRCVSPTGSFTDVKAYLDGSATATTGVADTFSEFVGTVRRDRTTPETALPVNVNNIDVYGGPGSDVLLGTALDDFLYGQDGGDGLYGMAGNDTITPGTGQNSVWGGSPNDQIDTDIGDKVDYSDVAGGRAISLDGLPNDGLNCVLDKGSAAGQTCGKENVWPSIEHIKTGAGNDEISASSKANTIETGAGNDLIYGGAGGDTIHADAGANKIYGDFGPYQRNSGVVQLPEGGGTDAPDVITAGNDGNFVWGGNESNPLEPAGDTITTGTGRDVIESQAGNDKVAAGNGDNEVTLGAGDDAPVNGTTVMVGSGKDTVHGNDGNDVITDGGGDNVVFNGGLGDDRITTGNGKDLVYGGTQGINLPNDGADTITTTGGDDWVSGGAQADYMDTGANSDFISYEEKTEHVYAVVTNSNAATSNSGTNCDIRTERNAAGSACEGDTVINAENLTGGTAPDTLGGDVLRVGAAGLECTGTNTTATKNTLKGGKGNDELFGCSDTDELFGDEGDDGLAGGTESDKIHGGEGEEVNGDSVSYEDCTDQCTSDGVRVTLGDGQPNDGPKSQTATQWDDIDADIENVIGSKSHDDLTGSGQDNTLDGRTGDDVLDGAAGADRLRGGEGTDLVTYESRSQDITVTLDDVADDGAAGEGDNVERTVEDLTGGSGHDSFTGQPAITGDEGRVSNAFTGNGGNDTFDGKFGADDFDGGDGGDTVIYSGRPSTDVVKVTMFDNLPGDGSATYDNNGGTEGTELDNVRTNIENLRGGDERDEFHGDAGVNIIEGGAGNDLILAEAGADTVNGGDGDDELFAGDDDDTIQPGLGNDEVFGEGATDYVDYEGRTPINVTFDDQANDGQVGSGETDNIHFDVERCGKPSAEVDCVTPAAPPAEEPPAEEPPAQEPPAENPPAGNNNTTTNNNTSTSTTSTNTGQSQTTTTTVSPTTTGSSTDTAKQSTALETIATQVGRTVLVRGRILVKARGTQAKASAACKKGGRVVVTVLKGKTVVGKRTSKVSRTCTFRAPVLLASSATGKLKVEVRFLGNRALKPTKRTTSLQVNG